MSVRLGLPAVQFAFEVEERFCVRFCRCADTGHIKKKQQRKNVINWDYCSVDVNQCKLWSI